MKTCVCSRKWILVLFIVLASFLLAACSSSTTTSPAILPATTLPVAPVPPSMTMPPVTTPVATTPATSLTATTPPSSGQAVTINLIARGMAFDKTTLNVPVGASVTIIFDNQDAGIPHNVSVYQNLPDGSAKPVFIGDVITGPKIITYQFTAPTAQGSYYFVCDLHPQIMKGPFTVTP